MLCLQELRCARAAAGTLLDAALGTRWAGVYAHRAFRCCEDSTRGTGYAGVALVSRLPLRSLHEPRVSEPADREGRVLQARVAAPGGGPPLTVVCVYAPNSGQARLERLSYRAGAWEPAFRAYLERLGGGGARVLVAGDLNVAAGPLDLHHGDPEREAARLVGYTPQERDAFARLLRGCGLVDSWRRLHPAPARAEGFTYWSNFARSRERNKGWRIDYCLASAELAPLLLRAEPRQDLGGSDHAPLVVDLASARGPGARAAGRGLRAARAGRRAARPPVQPWSRGMGPISDRSVVHEGWVSTSRPVGTR